MFFRGGRHGIMVPPDLDRSSPQGESWPARAKQAVSLLHKEKEAGSTLPVRLIQKSRRLYTEIDFAGCGQVGCAVTIHVEPTLRVVFGGVFDVRLFVSKLGRINDAELDISPLTVLVGPNNTNKTWTAYSLYGLARATSPRWLWGPGIGV